MYAGGHILSSALLGTVVARKEGLTINKSVFWIMLGSVIDFDHMLRYRLDDGAANSLGLHWLHMNIGVLLFSFFLLALFYKPWRIPLTLITAGVVLHLACDSLAYMLEYSFLWLGILDGLMLMVLISLYFRRDSGVKPIKISLFFFMAEIIASAIQFVVVIVGGFKPNEYWWVYGISPLMCAITAFLFLNFKVQKDAEGKLSLQSEHNKSTR